MVPAAFAHPRANRALHLPDATVAYLFERARRRTIGFMIGPDGLVVSAPRWVGQAEIDAAVAAGRAAMAKSGGTSTERLERFLRAGFSRDLMTPAHLRLKVDLWSAALTNPEIAAIERDLYASHREVVESLLDRMAAAYAVERIPVVADMIMATLDGLWLDWLRRGNEAAVKNGLEGCVLFARLRLGGN